ncbi:MAG: cyanophycinase [Sphingorhabdus sp.]
MRLFLVFAVAWLCTGTPLSAKSGSLLIVGGGLKDHDGAILRTLRDRMPDRQGRIAIVPSASGEASLAVQELTARLGGIGIDASRVSVVRIAMVDDEASTDINEAQWATNADNAGEIAKIEAADAVWFTGGDQLRTLRLLVDADGRDTPMLAAIRKKLSAGAVVAGTSAGAAIMGSNMIVCGTPDIAATGKVSRNPADCDVAEDAPVPLVLAPGLGFLKGVVVDQHFSQRNRWVRLLRATACSTDNGAQGFGVDEDTALLVDLASGKARVVGSGGVAHVARGKTARCDPFGFDGQRLSYKRSGESMWVRGEKE